MYPEFPIGPEVRTEHAQDLMRLANWAALHGFERTAFCAGLLLLRELNPAPADV